MAYNSNNLNICIPRLGEGENAANAGYSSAQWVYRDLGGDNLGVMTADNYITDGNDQGLRVGDIIAFVETGVDAEWMMVNTISAAGLVAHISFSNP